MVLFFVDVFTETDLPKSGANIVRTQAKVDYFLVFLQGK